eukprot:299517_1
MSALVVIMLCVFAAYMKIRSKSSNRKTKKIKYEKPVEQLQADCWSYLVVVLNSSEYLYYKSNNAKNVWYGPIGQGIDEYNTLKWNPNEYCFTHCVSSNTTTHTRSVDNIRRITGTWSFEDFIGKDSKYTNDEFYLLRFDEENGSKDMFDKYQAHIKDIDEKYRANILSANIESFLQSRWRYEEHYGVENKHLKKTRSRYMSIDELPHFFGHQYTIDELEQLMKEVEIEHSQIKHGYSSHEPSGYVDPNSVSAFVDTVVAENKANPKKQRKIRRHERANKIHYYGVNTSEQKCVCSVQRSGWHTCQW